MNDYPRDHHIWNPLFILFFAFLTVAVFVWIARDPSFVSNLFALSAFDFIVMSLATFRLIRLVTFDKVTYFFRVMFLDVFGDTAAKPAAGFRRAVSELIECIWCTGTWAALVVLALWFSSLFGIFAVYLLAISALGAVFQNLSHLITRIGVKQ